MQGFLVWFADSAIASFLRSAFAVALTLASADFVKAGSFDFSNWQMWVIAAIASALPVLLRWLNPQDSLGGASG